MRSVIIRQMKQIEIAQRVRQLKVGKHFMVKSERERQSASRVAKSLKDSGVIDFDVVTKEGDNGEFKVAAI